MSYEDFKTIAESIGRSRLMCSGILEDGDDCDNGATHKCWIGKAEDEWVGVCPSCAAVAMLREQRVENLP
jgi:hypothetical protein